MAAATSPCCSQCPPVSATHLSIRVGGLGRFCSIVGDTSLDYRVRDNAVSALGLASSPTQEELSALRRVAQGSEVPLRDTAILGLGGAVGNLQETDKRTAEALLQEINSALAGATTPREQSLLPLALGNTRAFSALPSLQLFLSSRAPEVRSAAVEALRFMPTPQADTLLSERVVLDESPDVRHAAVFAAGFRPLEPLLPAFQRVLQAPPGRCQTIRSGRFVADDRWWPCSWAPRSPTSPRAWAASWPWAPSSASW